MMSSFRPVAAVFVGVVLSGAVAAQSVVKIGHVGPVTGAIAHLGKDNELGARLAIEDLNARKLRIGANEVKFELLAEDASYSVVRRNLAGELYDSSPLDFLSRAGVMFLAPAGSSRLQVAGVSALATVLDGMFGPTFERQRREFWAAITQSLPPACPVLILHSEDDSLSPATFIAAFETELRRNGRTNVRRVCWPQSEHVAHLRRHPEEYTSAVRQWLDDCIACWRSASRQGVVSPVVTSKL